MVRIAPDSNDVFVLALDDGPGTHVNTGTFGTSGNWTDYGNPISNVSGVVGKAIYIPGSFTSPNHDGAGGANDIPVTPNISMSGWVNIRRSPNFFAEIFNKQYFLNNWVNPFLTFGIQMQNTSDGQWQFYITLNGTLQVISSGSNNVIAPGRWYHVGGTWDGATLTQYMNGSVIASSQFAGTIDYGTAGNRGQWYTGCIPGSSTIQGAPAIVQDIRVANIARPQSYFANIYFNGIYFNG